MKRPTFLTIWLVIMAISNLYSFYSYTIGASNLTKSLPGFSSWMASIYAVMALVALVGTGMLWNWKKAGFHIAIAITIFMFILNTITLGTVSGVISTIMALISLGILYLAMRPVLQNFK